MNTRWATQLRYTKPGSHLYMHGHTQHCLTPSPYSASPTQKARILPQFSARNLQSKGKENRHHAVILHVISAHNPIFTTDNIFFIRKQWKWTTTQRVIQYPPPWQHRRNGSQEPKFCVASCHKNAWFSGGVGKDLNGHITRSKELSKEFNSDVETLLEQFIYFPESSPPSIQLLETLDGCEQYHLGSSYNSLPIWISFHK